MKSKKGSRQNYPSSYNTGPDGGITQGGDSVQGPDLSKSERPDGSIKPPKPKVQSEAMGTSKGTQSASSNTDKSKQSNSSDSAKQNGGASKSKSEKSSGNTF